MKGLTTYSLRPYLYVVGATAAHPLITVVAYSVRRP